MKGIPTDQPLESTYWRKRTAPPAHMDPDRDGCGLLWCSPVAPAEGRLVRQVTALACEIMLRHGFEPCISLTLITERAVACILSLTYDRSVEGEDDRAMACYQELLRRMAEQGYHSYRFSIGGMNAMKGNSSYTDLLLRLRKTLDPNGIVSPGRYLPNPPA